MSMVESGIMGQKVALLSPHSRAGVYAGASEMKNKIPVPYSTTNQMEYTDNMNYPDFTAIDFETGSGYRNSVCQVGLVRVERGVIVETYSSLIRPPANFIRED